MWNKIISILISLFSFLSKTLETKQAEQTKSKSIKPVKHKKTSTNKLKFLILDEVLDRKNKHNLLCVCYAKNIKLKKIKGKVAISSEQVKYLNDLIDLNLIRGSQRIYIIRFLSKLMRE